MADAKRVLHVPGAMNRGGAETMLMSLYRGLDKDRMQFDFLEFSGGETHYSSEIGELGGHVIKSHWSQSPAHLISTIKEMRRLIGENGPYDAVHSHLNFRSAWVLLAARLAGVPIRVAHSHTGGTRQNDPLQMLYRAAMRHLILRHSTALVACSTDAGCFVFGKRQFLARGKVIPNAVDLSVFHPAEEVDARSLETMPKGPRRIVSVASLESVKNHEFLVDVAKILEDRGVAFQMLFVGDGSLRDELEARVDMLELTGHVRFLGVREDVADILRQSDVLVMPSHHEGLPVALVEAQATGLPCLVSESVTSDADLGLGLLHFISIDNASSWADALVEGMPKRKESSKINAAFEARGYNVEGALHELLALYRPQDS